ncbi:MAG: PGF-pre-PGF domain-containing protein [Candidatus Aenigmatarchaeota archaeon]
MSQRQRYGMRGKSSSIISGKSISLVVLMSVSIILLSSATAFATDFWVGPQCYLYDGDNSGCGTLPECMWTTNTTDPFCMDPVGCCIMPMGGGCMMNDGNMTGCDLDTRCTWKANNNSQNPMCPINPSNYMFSGITNTVNIGCCMQVGCDNYINQGESNCTSALNGICSWDNGTYCPEVQRYGAGENIGCCFPTSCPELNETACNASMNAGMPCTWSEGACIDQGFGSFGSESDCTSKGGWWNATANTCAMPTMGGGGGPGMFGGQANCRLFFGRSTTCLNVTGCVYCTDDADLIATQSSKGNRTNTSSVCYNMNDGECIGHETVQGYDGFEINSTAMACSDIKLKMSCLCGPMSYCTWNSSTYTNGSFCADGVKTDSQRSVCQAPSNARFCDDTGSKNNQTLCEMLANTYMMPCIWNTNMTPNQCTFKKEMIFGGSGGQPGQMNTFQDISSEQSCIAAKGQWKTDTYVEQGIVKSKQFCDMAYGKGFDRCNNTCWACEYQDDGTDWANATVAEQACNASSLGYCQWATDTSAPNGFGWCDFPTQFSFGAGDCSSNCQDCSYSNDPQSACLSSAAGCKWDSMMSSCVSNTARTCNSTCSECWSRDNCVNTGGGGSSNCTWSDSNYVCTAKGFTGEVCFDGIDNDNDRAIDCGDTDCSFDQFCGGRSMSSCGQYTNTTACGNATSGIIINGTAINCTWFTPQFGGSSFCSNPGEQCWSHKENETACNNSLGCEWAANMMGGQCDINQSSISACFQLSNYSDCSSNGNCSWMNDTYNIMNSRCEPLPFVRCGMNQSKTNETVCNADPYCVWVNEAFGPADGTFVPDMNITDMMIGGHCEPACFNRSINSSEQCLAAWSGMCSWSSTECRPVIFAGSYGGGAAAGGGGFRTGCAMYDINYSACMMNNMSCVWINQSFSPTGGYCSDKMVQDMFSGMMKTGAGGAIEMGSPPVIVANKARTTGVNDSINIREFGLKDEFKAFMFGVSVWNISPAAVCNGYPISTGIGGGMDNSMEVGNGSATAKFYWYMDTDAITTGGCTAIGTTANYTGFEFMMKYETAYSASTNYTETKAFYICSNSTWIPTTTVISPWRQMGCSMAGGAVVGIEKQSLRKFVDYDITKTMRMLVTTANSTGSYNNPQDMLGPSYYTPGAADFRTECCDSPGADCNHNGIPSDRDADCRFIKKMGYVPQEDCMNNRDDNNDGLTDCQDPSCMMSPKCGGVFSFVSNVSDKTSPTVTRSKADPVPDGAFIQVDTNEPANMTILFYYNDTNCMILNASVHDVGGPGAFDDYKPFHMAPIDSYIGNPQRLAYNLTNGTTYHYKTRVCDPSGNCANSACLNFSTSSSYSTFLFKMAPPTGFRINAPLLGVTNDNMSNSVAVNASMTKNVNISIECPAAGYSMEFTNIDFGSTKSISLTNITCNDTSQLIGMPTANWQRDIVSSLGMPEEIKMQYHVPYANFTGIRSCLDDGTNCTNVTDYSNCTGNTSDTWCMVPVSLGFSTYKLDTVAATTETPASSGSGGGGGAAANTTTAVLNQKMIWASINSSAEARFAVTASNLSITDIRFNVTSTLTSVSLDVIDKQTQPASVSAISGKKVYKWLEIQKTGLTDSNLNGNVQIKFFVDNTWLTTNNVNENSIKLLRYNNGAWTELATTKNSKGATLTTYTALTPGFSYFAVAGTATTTTTTTTPTPTTTSTGDATTTTTTTVEDTGLGTPAGQYTGAEGEATPLPMEAVVGIIIVLVVIAGAIYYTKYAKTKKSRSWSSSRNRSYKFRSRR